MSSILSSQGVVVATVMAVSGAIFLLVFRRQKTLSTTQFSVDQNSNSTPRILRSCISTYGKKRDIKKKKRVHFADDVVDPDRNREEFKREFRHNQGCPSENRRMPPNRRALYNGILRDRVQRMACTY